MSSEHTVRSIESPTGCDVDGGGGLDVSWLGTTCPLHVQRAFSPRPASVQPTFIPQATRRRPTAMFDCLESLLNVTC